MSNLSDTVPVLVGERYLIGEPVGHGGTAVVHRAWDSVLNGDVAVKMLTRLSMDGSARARFEDEGQALARLNHPGLTTLFDAGTEQGRPYLVMEFVEGQTLGEYCRRHWPSADEVMSIGAALAETLTYVHSCGIVHRDVKPSNVLLGPEQQVRLADFGIARLLESVVRHTETGLTVGTVAYLAPEQVRGEAITGATDIYALGLVLLEALTGRPAFTGSMHEVALARLNQSPPIDESLPPGLRLLLAAMTATEPRSRPTAEEVASSLRAGAVLPTMTMATPSEPRRRIPVLAALGLAAATSVALVLASPLGGTEQAVGEPRPTPSATPSAEVTASPTPAATGRKAPATAAKTTSGARASQVNRVAAERASRRGPAAAAAHGPGKPAGPGKGPRAGAGKKPAGKAPAAGPGARPGP